MNVLSSLWDKFRRKDYRHAFVAAELKRGLPRQIRALRKQRGWTQAKLATEARLTQGAISRAEDPDYGNMTLNNLLNIAAGFDVAFVGRFVPFSDLAKWVSGLEEESNLFVPSFDDDELDGGAVAEEIYADAWASTVRARSVPSAELGPITAEYAIVHRLGSSTTDVARKPPAREERILGEHLEFASRALGEAEPRYSYGTATF